MLELLLPLLGNLLPGILSRVLPPEKMSEEDAAKIQHELTMTLINQDWNQIQAEYADRNSARVLAAQDIAKGNAFTGMLAAIVRPLWGIGAFILVVYSVLYHSPIDGALQSIITTVLAFYFGGRVIEKVTPHITAAITKE